jgi:hypothetical protein
MANTVDQTKRLDELHPAKGREDLETPELLAGYLKNIGRGQATDPPRGDLPLKARSRRRLKSPQKAGRAQPAAGGPGGQEVPGDGPSL